MLCVAALLRTFRDRDRMVILLMITTGVLILFRTDFLARLMKGGLILILRLTPMRSILLKFNMLLMEDATPRM